MTFSRTAVTRAVVAFVALAVVVSAVTVGGVAQTDSENGTASDGEAEPNDSMANATPVAYGEEINATLSSPDDVDYYAVNATAGDAVVPRLHLKNAFEGSGIQVDVVAPSDEVTTELTNDLISGPQHTAGEASFTGGDTAYTGDVMESDGTYYVRVQEATDIVVGGPETDESDTYRYSLTVNRTAVDEYEPNENGTTATPLGLDERITAAFAGYDSDVYAVDLTAGENYTVHLDHPEGESHFYNGSLAVFVYENRSQPVDDPAADFVEDGGSPWDFRQPNGTTVAADNPVYGGTTALSFTAERGGTHYVQIVQGQENGHLLDLNEYEMTVNRTDGTTPDGGDAETPEPPSDGDAGTSEPPDDGDADSGDDPDGDDDADRESDPDGDDTPDDC